MPRKRNRKLLVQIGIITLLIFVATLAYSMITDYSITEKSFLSSKNEMIDRDLINMSSSEAMTGMTSWFWDYTKEHGDDITRALTEEEIARLESEEIQSALNAYSYGERNDFAECDPELQMFNARNIFQVMVLLRDMEIKQLKYASIDCISFTNEHEAFLYLRNTADEPDVLSEESFSDPYNTFAYSEAFKTISYEASQHSAVRQILAGELNEAGKTLYEVYSDPTDGKVYYIGYTPVVFDGVIGCYQCIRYDFTEFRRDLLNHAMNSMIIGFLVLVVLNTLLMLFIFVNAIKPLSKVKTGVEEYMNDKNSEAVVEKMSRIATRNEIGAVADRFADLAQEIDRYTNENMRLVAEKEHVAAELSLATNIQTSMLPNIFPAFPERKEFELYASMDPAKEVGGDFYDFFLVDDDHLGMVIADVSGKGVPAALFMMAAKILINDHALMGGTPAEILARVNKQVCANNDAHMFVTVWLGILEISTGKLTASNAGHEYPMLNSNGRYEMLKDKHGMPIGAFKKSKYTNYEITLKKGDCIFVYTDGVAEATDANDELFGTERTVEVLNAAPDASPENILGNVRAAVDAFVKEAPQFDDLTMLAFRYLGTEENQ